MKKNNILLKMTKTAKIWMITMSGVVYIIINWYIHIQELINSLTALP